MKKRLTHEGYGDMLFDMDWLGERNFMSRFFNNNSINLFTYMDSGAAWSLQNNGISVLNTPIEMYESPYTARMLAGDISKKTLMIFAVNLSKLYDTLDIGLTQDKNKLEIRKKEMQIVRELKRFSGINSSKSLPYISYIVYNKACIVQYMNI